MIKLKLNLRKPAIIFAIYFKKKFTFRNYRKKGKNLEFRKSWNIGKFTFKMKFFWDIL